MWSTKTCTLLAVALLALTPLTFAAAAPAAAPALARAAAAPLSTSASTASQDDISGGNYTDCADPTVANLSHDLVLGADIVITGLVAAAGNGTGRCSKGSELVGSFVNGTSDTIAVLVVVQCVHKGAIACRTNAADAASGACVVLLTAPAGDAGGAPCGISQGGKYMFLLSATPGGPQPSCGPGWYSTMNPHTRDSVRTPLGLAAAGCFPYPTWPVPDTDFAAAMNGTADSSSCPGGATPVDCSASSNGTCAADGTACGDGSAIGCVTKACPGRLMFGGSQIQANATCKPVYFDRASGLHKNSCDAAVRRVTAQQKRLRRQVQPGGAVTRANADATSKPTLKSLDQLLNTPLDINGGLQDQFKSAAAAKQGAATSAADIPSPLPAPAAAAPSAADAPPLRATEAAPSAAAAAAPTSSDYTP